MIVALLRSSLHEQGLRWHVNAQPPKTCQEALVTKDDLTEPQTARLKTRPALTTSSCRRHRVKIVTAPFSGFPRP